MRRWHALFGLVVLAVVASACGKTTTVPPGTGGANRAADSLILRMSTEGGFLPPDFRFRQIPEFTLTGDGRVFSLGAQIEIYPPPAMPPVLVRTVTAEAVAEIIKEAKAAGLDGPDKEYRYDLVADAGTTVFSFIDDDGATHTISAYALGMEAQGGDPPPGQTADERAARAKLADLQKKLSDLSSWLPKGSVGEDKPAEPTKIRVFAGAYATNAEEPQQTPKAWPLSTPLGTFGAPADDTYRCGVVEGADLDRLLPELKASTTRTPWTSAGKQYELILRPLLPDESGCPAKS